MDLDNEAYKEISKIDARSSITSDNFSSDMQDKDS
jgi:hypothetical protein